MSNRGNVAGYTTYRAEVAQRSREEAAESRPLGMDTGWTVVSYMLAGPLAYGLIGWLIARFTHVQFLFPVGLLFGVAISVGYVIFRYGRLEKQPEELGQAQPAIQEHRTAKQAQNSRAGTGRNDR
jgi:ATP synthase protein I